MRPEARKRLTDEGVQRLLHANGLIVPAREDPPRDCPHALERVRKSRDAEEELRVHEQVRHTLEQGAGLEVERRDRDSRQVLSGNEALNCNATEGAGGVAKRTASEKNRVQRDVKNGP